VKIEIELDDAKIVADGKYEVDEVYRRLESVLKSQGLKYDGVGCVSGYGTQNDYAYCININLELKDKDWFMPYVKKWHWYTEHGCNDGIKHYARKLRKAYEPIQ